MGVRECTYFLACWWNPAYVSASWGSSVGLEEEQPEHVADREEDQDDHRDDDGHQAHHRQELGSGLSVHIDDRR